MNAKTKLVSLLSVPMLILLSGTNPAQAADYSGVAQCPQHVGGGIAATGEQIDTSKFMYVSVGSKSKSGFGFDTLTVTTQLRKSSWFISGEKLTLAVGYCMPD